MTAAKNNCNNHDFESQLRRHFAGRPVSDPAAPALPENVWRMLADFVCRGGKRMRPQIFLAAVSSYGRPLDAACRQMALAIELLHQFALIHDDIVDRARRRRGAPTVHRRFDALLDNTALTGADLALTTGDWLFAHAMRLITDLPVSARTSRRLMRLVTGAAETAALGQAVELCAAAGLCRMDAGRALSLFAAKTASYSFACPLQAAGIMAGKPERTLLQLAHAGRLFGQAYQICDDLEDFAPDAPKNPHLQITLPCLMLVEHTGARWKKTPPLSVLRGKLNACGIMRQCRDLARKLTIEGYACLADAGLSLDIAPGMLSRSSADRRVLEIALDIGHSSLGVVSFTHLARRSQRRAAIATVCK